MTERKRDRRKERNRATEKQSYCVKHNDMTERKRDREL